MGSFVNFLKNLFSGLFSFIGGLLGSKKKEAIEGSAPTPQKANSKKASKSGYFLELDEAKGVGNTAPAKAVAAPSTAKAESTKAEPSNGATATPKVAAPKPAPKPVGASAALNLPQPTVTTFAPKYLAPTGSSNGRRRPGANMSSFLDMARQVKTSS